MVAIRIYIKWSKNRIFILNIFKLFTLLLFLYSSNNSYSQKHEFNLGVKTGLTLLNNKKSFIPINNIKSHPANAFSYGFELNYINNLVNGNALFIGISSDKVNYSSKLEKIEDLNLSLKVTNSVRNLSLRIGYGKKYISGLGFSISLNPGIFYPISYSLSSNEISFGGTNYLNDTIYYTAVTKTAFKLKPSISSSVEVNYDISKKINISFNYCHFFQPFPPQEMEIYIERNLSTNQHDYS